MSRAVLRSSSGTKGKHTKVYVPAQSELIKKPLLLRKILELEHASYRLELNPV